MRSSLLDPRVLLLPAFSVFILAVAGCQSGDGARTLDVAGDQKPAEQKVTEAELRGFCPRVTLRDGTSFFSTYARGGQDDPTKVVYQASLSDVSRSCVTADGMLTMKVAVAGRVVPGPAFSPGTITMPIRIAVQDAGNVVYSQIHNFQVQIGSTAAATQFVFNDPNVAVPEPGAATLQVFAGYDEGPPAKKTARRN